MAFQPQLFVHNSHAPTSASRSSSFYHYHDSGRGASATRSAERAEEVNDTTGSPSFKYERNYLSVPDDANDEHDTVIDMTDENDEDLLAMTEEEKQQFASQLDHWEAIRRVQSLEVRKGTAASQPQYKNKVFSTANLCGEDPASRSPSRESMKRFTELMSGYQYASNGRRPSTLASTGPAESDAFYKKSSQWSKKLEAAMSKQRQEQEKVQLSECTFAPLINKNGVKKSSRPTEPHPRHEGVAHPSDTQEAEVNENDLSQHRQRASEAFEAFIKNNGQNKPNLVSEHPQQLIPGRVVAAAAASRLYEEHEKRKQNKEARLAAAAEEQAQQCTFTPRVCRKRWAQGIAPRYLDAYAEQLDAQDDDGEYKDADEAERAASTRAATSFRAPSTYRSVGRSSGRGHSNPPLDDNCTFRPVTNNLNRLHQQYKGAHSIYGTEGVPLPPVPTNFGDPQGAPVQPSIVAEPTINIEALSTYLSLPAHERLALDAKRKHQSQLVHQQLMDKLIADQAKPIINARSASVVTLNQKHELQKQKESGSNNVSAINTSQAFLQRLESSNAKREARKALLTKTVQSIETPFAPRTNSKYSRVVKSHFEQEGYFTRTRAAGSSPKKDGDKENNPTTADHGREVKEPIQWGGRATPPKTSRSSKIDRHRGDNRRADVAAQVPTRETTPRRTTPRGQTPSRLTRVGGQSSTKGEAADPECTFKPAINSTSTSSRYAQIEAARVRREAKLEQLREELTLEREQKELGIDLDAATMRPETSQLKGIPAASDLTPRRPFSPSISKKTNAIAKERNGHGVSLAKVTNPSADPEVYLTYIAASERRKKAKIEEQQAEKKLLEEAQLTFRPTIHEVPDYIRAMGQALKARGETSGRMASGGGVPVHRAANNNSNHPKGYSSFMTGYLEPNREAPSLGMRFT